MTQLIQWSGPENLEDYPPYLNLFALSVMEGNPPHIKLFKSSSFPVLWGFCGSLMYPCLNKSLVIGGQGTSAPFSSLKIGEIGVTVLNLYHVLGATKDLYVLGLLDSPKQQFKIGLLMSTIGILLDGLWLLKGACQPT